MLFLIFNSEFNENCFIWSFLCFKSSEKQMLKISQMRRKRNASFYSYEVLSGLCWFWGFLCPNYARGNFNISGVLSRQKQTSFNHKYENTIFFKSVSQWEDLLLT